MAVAVAVVVPLFLDGEACATIHPNAVAADKHADQQLSSPLTHVTAYLNFRSASVSIQHLPMPVAIILQLRQHRETHEDIQFLIVIQIDIQVPAIC